jgi:hypothetical protein
VKSEERLPRRIARITLNVIKETKLNVQLGKGGHGNSVCVTYRTSSWTWNTRNTKEE